MKTMISILMMFASVATATVDFNPPSWRDSPGSTWQAWTFSTSEVFPAPDDFHNLYGTPGVTEVKEGQWNDDHYSQHQGIWRARRITFSVPNDPATTKDTKYHVQIVWNPSATAPVGLSLFIGSTQGEPAVKAQIIDNFYDSNFGWNYTTFEVVTATFNSTPLIYYEAQIIEDSLVIPVYIDAVIIDSVLIPEPATLLLFAVGGGLLRRRCRR